MRRCTRRDAAVRWNGVCRGYVAGQPGMHVDGADPCYPREARPLGERMRISKEDGVRRRDIELRLPHRRTSVKEGVGRKRKEEKDAGKRAAPAGGLQRAGRAWERRQAERGGLPSGQAGRTACGPRALTMDRTDGQSLGAAERKVGRTGSQFRCGVVSCRGAGSAARPHDTRLSIWDILLMNGGCMWI